MDLGKSINHAGFVKIASIQKGNWVSTEHVNAHPYFLLLSGVDLFLGWLSWWFNKLVWYTYAVSYLFISWFLFYIILYFRRQIYSVNSSVFTKWMYESNNVKNLSTWNFKWFLYIVWTHFTEIYDLFKSF